MRVGELFAGIGGFGLAAQRAGASVVWASEIHPFASKVYATHFPETTQLGDCTKIVDPPAVDLITAGFPCQDLSVAGKRKGLIGERSGLFFEIIRIAARLRPRWLLLENVPGLLSSNKGRDFETVLAALDALGYGVAWRVLDAQFFGVPQRRRRVFIVGHLGSPCPAEVLFEPEGVSGNTPARGKKRAGVTRGVAACLNSGGNAGGFRTEPGEHLVAMSLLGKGHSSHAEDMEAYVAQCHGSNVGPMGALRKGNGNETGGVPFIARPITSSSYKGHDEDTDTIIAHALSCEGADASEDGTGRGTPIVASVVSNGDAHSGFRDEHGIVPVMFGDPRRHDIRGVHRGDLREKPCLNATNNDLLLNVHPRRLTPRECERLQGFPDDWTLINGASDSARYRALGNAVAVPCVEWIIRRLVAVDVTLFGRMAA